MKIYRIGTVSLGFGLLFAWMQSLFLDTGLFASPAGKVYEKTDFIVLFLAVHALTYLVRGWEFSGKASLPSSRVLFLAAAGMTLSLPVFLSLASFFSADIFPSAAAAGVLLSASGSALLIGQWSEFLSTFPSEDVALVFGLSPLAAALLIFLTSMLHSFLLLFLAPLASACLLLFLDSIGKRSGDAGIFPPQEEAPDLPFWRIGLFLFCFYGANGFLMSVFPEIFPSPFPRADQLAGWVRMFSCLGVAAVFRYYPRASLSNFYRGAFPFFLLSLFLFSFSPFRYVSRLLLEGGLAFLDLYAWLLLFFFASHAGRRRTSVVNGGLFLIVLASAASHLHLLLKGNIGFWPGESSLTTLMFLTLLFLLLLIALWDGHWILLQWNEVTSAGVRGEAERNISGEGMTPSAQKNEMEEEMTCRMRILPYNLTRQETEIVLLLLQGNKDSSICSSLFIARNTLKFHLRNIYRKTGIANRTELKKEILQAPSSEHPLADTSGGG